MKKACKHLTNNPNIAATVFFCVLKVAARYLKQFGYSSIKVIYPKSSSRAPFPLLVSQLESQKIAVESSIDFTTDDSTILIDALFGFSFKPRGETGISPPYSDLVQEANKRKGKFKVVSVDVPSGWLVDKEWKENEGKVGEGKIVKLEMPDVVVCLSGPKKCVKSLKEKGVVLMCGGRFVPRELEKDMGIVLPKYRGAELVATL